jgi:hypothetical protein
MRKQTCHCERLKGARQSSQKIFWIASSLLLLAMTLTPAHAAIEGGVSKTGAANTVVDSANGAPVAGARVSLPKQNYST